MSREFNLFFVGILVGVIFIAMWLKSILMGILATTILVVILVGDEVIKFMENKENGHKL